MEVWKDIPGFEQKYQVSNCGNVRSLNYLHTGRVENLRPDNTRKGYIRFTIWNEKEEKCRFLAHRLVMLAFVGESDLQVNHKNGNKSDNHLDNLEYCTGSENQKHSYTFLSKKTNPAKGVDTGHAKLAPHKVKSIKELHSTGAHSYTKLAKMFGVHKQTIAGIIQGKTWRHLSDEPK